MYVAGATRNRRARRAKRGNLGRDTIRLGIHIGKFEISLRMTGGFRDRRAIRIQKGHPRLGVALANALQTKTTQGADAVRVRALAAYKDFLALWNDADPDIPILKEAKAEYEKLQ